MSRNVIIIGIAVILVGVIAMLYFYDLGYEDIIRAKPDYELTAEELYYEFSNDENSANEKYVGKLLEVAGKLNRKEITSDSTLNLVLETGQAAGSVVCSFKDTEISNHTVLEEGDEVIIKGICTGRRMDVILEDCYLLKP
jgi:hypothetical protein